MNLVANPLLGFGVAPELPVAGTLTVVDNEDGTATFTYSGSSTDAINTLYTRVANNTNPSVWEDQGSITEDGTWNVSFRDGNYYAYVSSTTLGGTVITDILHFTIHTSGHGINAICGVSRDPSFQMFGQPITYQKYTSGGTNPRTGTTTKTFTDYEIALVLVSDASDEDVKGTHEQVQIGDMLFRIRRQDCPDSTPDLRSQIVFDGVTWEIVHHRRSADLYVWDVFGRQL